MKKSKGESVYDYTSINDYIKINYDKTELGTYTGQDNPNKSAGYLSHDYEKGYVIPSYLIEYLNIDTSKFKIGSLQKEIDTTHPFKIHKDEIILSPDEVKRLGKSNIYKLERIRKYLMTDSEKYKSGFSGGGPIKTNNIDDLLQDNTLTIKQKLDLINKSGLLTPTVGNKYESKISPTLDFYKKEDDLGSTGKSDSNNGYQDKAGKVDINKKNKNNDMLNMMVGINRLLATLGLVG